MRLRRSDLTAPGICRRRCGRGFHYRGPDGEPITDPDELRRIRRLAVPPAWQDVWICPYANGHIQAIGVDSAGRRQYLYHQEWRRARDEEKYDRVLTLAPRLPEFRTRVAADLRVRGLGRDRVLAAALRMLDRGVFRVGNEEYAEDNGTYGAVTLLREHVRTRAEWVSFHYPAKGGVELSLSLHDPLLRTVVAALLRARAGSDRLLVYHDRRGWREVAAEDVNARFKELVGEEFSVKDLRTWNATVLGAVALGEAPPPRSRRAARRAVAAAMREVAEHLGNTPAVAKKSYVDPRVVTLFERGISIHNELRRVGTVDLSTEDIRTEVEHAVLRMLTSGERPRRSTERTTAA